MEQKLPPDHKKHTDSKKQKPEVYVLRDLREYLGESVLIVFSVLLALVLTEYFNNLHEKRNTREMLANVRSEIIKNKQVLQDQYAYERNILKAIDSALKTPEFQKKIVENDAFHLFYIAPQGVINRDLSTTAWDVAKSNNIAAKASFGLIEKLTNIYANQARIDKLEDKVAAVLLSGESRKAENVHQTLVLIRDNYHGWAFDRTPNLITDCNEAIKAIDRVE